MTQINLTIIKKSLLHALFLLECSFFSCIVTDSSSCEKTTRVKRKDTDTVFIGPYLKQPRPQSPAAERGRTASWTNFKPAVWMLMFACATKPSSFDLWRRREKYIKSTSEVMLSLIPVFNFSFLFSHSRTIQRQYLSLYMNIKIRKRIKYLEEAFQDYR